MASRRAFRAILAAAAAAAIACAACGGDVSSSRPPANDSSGAEEAETGAGAVDPECFDGCVAKGLSEDDCAEACTGSDEVGEKGSNGARLVGPSPGKSEGSGDADVPGGGSSGAGGSTNTALDLDLEKTCAVCWTEHSRARDECADAVAACEADLACTQLQWCPAFCDSGEGCFDECNEVIPSGVDLMTRLVQCTTCGAGPCAEACRGSLALGYCQ